MPSATAAKSKRKPAAKRLQDRTEPQRPTKSRRVEYRWEPVSHVSHLQEAGQLFVLGDGDCGQLGLGEDVMSASRPLASLDREKVKQAVCGGMHTALVTDTGAVLTTGVNDEGALGRKTAVRVAGAAWEKEGEGLPGVATDQYSWGVVKFPSTAKPVVQLSAGDSHTAALDSDGQVFAWGTFRGDAGVFGFAPGQRIALLPTLVIKPDIAAQQIVKIVSGADHVLALQRNGTVLSWGVGMVGQLGRVGLRMASPEATQLTPAPVPFVKRRPPTSHFVDIAAGSYSSFSVDDKGHVFAWGLNNYHQLGLSGKGPFFAPQYVKLLEGKDTVEVQGGQHHTLVRTRDNKLLSFGRGTYGRLGRRNGGVDPEGDEGYLQPGQVEGLDDVPVHSMCAGLAVSACVAGTPGSAYLWGFGTNNQLGKGEDDDSDEHVPAKLKATKRLQGRPILQVAIGGQHVALLSGSPDMT